MFPWLWIYAPKVELPWSGDLAQRVEPRTRWFFQGINAGAGDARVEEKAFEVASYGKQLGLITEVLIDLARQAGTHSPQAAESLARLERIAAEIDSIKHLEGRRAAT